jgi:hypothetical protein
VGINTAVAGVGLGLAVPIRDATRKIVGALITDGASGARISVSAEASGLFRRLSPARSATTAPSR